MAHEIVGRESSITYETPAQRPVEVDEDPAEAPGASSPVAGRLIWPREWVGEVGRRLLVQALGAVGVEKRDDDFAISFAPALWVSAAATVAAVLLLVYLAGNFAGALLRFPFYGPTALVEEVAYTYTSAGNFIKYGFLNSGFLQDFSSSSSLADHPFVYTHMPPGPDIVTALLLKLYGGSYQLVRATFFLVSMAGLWFFYKFASIVLDRANLKGAALAVLFLSPFGVFQNFDRHTTFSHGFLLFAPLVWLQSYYRSGRRWYLFGVLALAFVGSFVLEYSYQGAVLCCWVALYVTQLVPIRGRHALAFLGVVGGGILLHLLQDLIFLGPAIFTQEITMTLGNRIAGVPSQEAMKSFYEAIGVVHHGAHSPSLSVLLAQVVLQVTFPAQGLVALLLGVALLLVLVRSARRETSDAGRLVLLRGQGTASLSYFAKIWAWVFFSVLMPLGFFPAFSQEVNLYGARDNLFFVGIAVAASVAFVVARLAEGPLPIARSLDPLIRQVRGSLLRSRAYRWPALAVGIGVWCALLVMLAFATQDVAASIRGEVANVRSQSIDFKYEQLADMRNFAGHLFMTNINSPTVGFFVKEAGFGVCGLDSLPDAGGVDASVCKIAFMRQVSAYANRRPDYFFFFSSGDLFPGFADCLPSSALIGQTRGGDDCVTQMHQRLSQRFKKVFENQLFSVYNLAEPL